MPFLNSYESTSTSYTFRTSIATGDISQPMNFSCLVSANNGYIVFPTPQPTSNSVPESW